MSGSERVRWACAAVIAMAAAAVLAMGADRYAMVAEPAFYVLIALLFGLVTPRRREHTP